MIALYPGAFKPPHRGHFEVVRRLLKGTHGGHVYSKDSGAEAGAKALAGQKGKVEKIDKVIVFPGGGERNGITKGESMAIWKIYAKYLPGIEVRDGEKNPMFAAKDYAAAKEGEKFYAVTGVRDESDFKDLKRITTFKKVNNVEGLLIPSAPGDGVRATDLRKAALEGNLDDLRDFFPRELSRQELLTILKMLKDNVIAEIMNQKMEDLFEAMFTAEQEEAIEEGSSGTPLGNNMPIRSEDKAKLVTLYNRIRHQVETPGVKVTFHQDHIRVGLENEAQRSDFDFTPYMASILEYMIDEGMKITPLPEVKIKKDLAESEDFFGKTAYYDPNAKEVVLYTQGRHPKDVMRSFTHEMVHHMQNLEGRLGGISTSNTNEDDHLLEIEKEAYLKGNITFRNWEDRVKNMTEDKDGKKAFSREIQVNEDSKYDEYEELASELAESLTRMFQSKGDKEFNHSMTVKREIEGRPFEFDLEVVLGFDSKVKEFEGQGYAYAGEEEDEEEDEDYFYWEDDSITIHISVNPNLEKKYQVMELGLMHFLVHEMEHLVHGEGLNKVDSKFVYEDPLFRSLVNSGEYGDGEEATAEYKILPREVAAGVKELAARAKATGNSFDEEVEEELDKAGITTPKFRRKVKLAYRKFIGKNELDLEIYV